MNSQYFTLFLEEANELWPKGRDALEQHSNVELFLRIAHTLKGMAGTMGYNVLADTLHEVEELAKQDFTAIALAEQWQQIGNALDIATASASEAPLKKLGGAPTTDVEEAGGDDSQVPAKTAALRIEVDKLDTMFDAVGQLHTRLRVLETVPAASKAWDREMRNVQALITRSVHHVAGLRLSSLNPLARLFEESLLDAARQTGKPVTFHSTGTSVRVAREVVERLRPLIPHIARNALAHGIEDRETRKECNKPEAGRIAFSAVQTDGDVQLTIRDDGGGIDLDALRDKAADAGIESRLSDDEAAALLFRPGFSTKASADALAGRGVGLDAVKEAIESAGGSVSLRHEYGQFFELCMQIPVPLSLQNLLEVEIGNTPVGILDRQWEQLDTEPDPERKALSIPGLDSSNAPLRICNDLGYLGVHRWERLGAVHVHRMSRPLASIPNVIGFYLDKTGTPRLVYRLR